MDTWNTFKYCTILEMGWYMNSFGTLLFCLQGHDGHWGGDLDRAFHEADGKDAQHDEHLKKTFKSYVSYHFGNGMV